VWDLRPVKSSPAEWTVLENEAVVCFVLLPTDEPAMGSFVSESAGLKWDRSINITEDVRMLAMWAGADVSRTGCHGTQMYAYLATDLQGCPASQMAARVESGSVGMEWIAPSEKKAVFQTPQYARGVNQEIGEVTIHFSTSYSSRVGYNDKKGWQYSTVPAKTSVVIAGESYAVGTEFNIPAIIEKIREILPARSFELEEALLSEEYLRSKGNIEVVRSLVQLYQANGLVADTGLCADYAARKASESSDADVLFDLSGHFRRMGASRNSDIWVIDPDGKLREPDELVRRKQYPEGNKRWLRVEAAELAVSWYVGLLRDVYAGSSCEVLHEPVGGRTQIQIEMLRRIEEEIGVQKGSFGSFSSGKNSQGAIARAESGVGNSTPAEPASASDLTSLLARFAK